MPGVKSKANELKAKYYRGAPKANQPKIEEVMDVYRSGKNVNFRTVEDVVMGLYSPTLVGRTRAERSYQDLMNAYANAEEAAPEGLVRVRRARQRAEEELARLKGVKKKFQLDVLLYTDEEKRSRDAFLDDRQELGKEEEKRMRQERRRYTRRHKGLSQYHKGSLEVEAPTDIVLKECK